MVDKPVKKRLTKKRKLELIQGSGGVLKDIAALAGVNRCTVRAWRDSDSDIAEAISQEREETSDQAEKNVINAIREGDVKTSQWWLATIGKNRGFTTRQEIDAEVKSYADVNIYIPDNGRGSGGSSGDK